jgi:hypothetical protein
MRRWPPRVGSCWAKPACLLLWIADRKPRLRAARVLTRALWPGGSDFAAKGSGRPPCPGALGISAPVIPRKIWHGPVLPPPKFPGVLMESCLELGPGPSGCGPGGPTWPVTPDPDRHRGWLLCPSSVPAATGQGLRPRVSSAHMPLPQL